MKNIVLICVCSITVIFLSHAQTNVRGAYNNGQVWIVWKTTPPEPETYAIYSSSTSFTTTNQATLIGRLFWQEWSGYDLKHNANDTSATFKIPVPPGTIDTLDSDEGLFVETVTSTGSKYYAVVKYGDTLVTPSKRVHVNYTYNLNEPPTCYVQYSDTNAQGFPYKIYCMWVDGRDDWWGGRPDFPVMANQYKNGAPHLFIVSEPISGQGPGNVPAVILFHGGSGIASQWIPPDKPEINITPGAGLIVAHNDKLWRVDSLDPNYTTWFFGWYKSFNPFLQPPPILPQDTVINYNQRRIIWIDDWLVRNRSVDSTRISIFGYSMGSGGATELMKAYPNKFAAACIFNNGLNGPANGNPLFGDRFDNLPTNLRDINGSVVSMSQVFDLTSNISPYRDLPLVRVFDGKNDQNEAMHWDTATVENYRKADSLGYGMQLYWDERGHGIDLWLNSHWAHSANSLDQTLRDNAAYQYRYSSNQSFPAFYNHRLDTANNDPGTGVGGIPSPDGSDDWGTWGGWHDWDVNSIIDSDSCWEVCAYLIGQFISAIDISSHDSLKADVAIRKPQHFLPPAGTVLQWRVIHKTTGDTLQSGLTTVRSDGLVAAPGIWVHKEPDSVRIQFKYAALSAVNIRDGWNLLSLPLTVADPSKSTVYPTAVSDAFTYNGSYQIAETLSYGQGFWLKFNGSQIVAIAGTERSFDTLNVAADWNLIGSISSPIATSSITSIPVGIVTSNFFEFEGSYVIADTIRPGQGYWVKATQAGQIILASSPTASPGARIRIIPTAELPPAVPDEESNSADRTSKTPKEFALNQNYPNPLNPSTVISYSLPVQSYVALKVFNLLGQKVATLVDGVQEPGYKSVRWDASGVPSGMYYYRLQAEKFVDVKKLLLVK